MIQYIKRFFNGGSNEPLSISTNKDDLISKRLLEVRKILGKDKYEFYADNYLIKVDFQKVKNSKDTQQKNDFIAFCKSLKLHTIYYNIDTLALCNKRTGLNMNPHKFQRLLKLYCEVSGIDLMKGSCTINKRTLRHFKLV